MTVKDATCDQDQGNNDSDSGRAKGACWYSWMADKSGWFLSIGRVVMCCRRCRSGSGIHIICTLRVVRERSRGYAMEKEVKNHKT